MDGFDINNQAIFNSGSSDHEVYIRFGDAMIPYNSLQVKTLGSQVNTVTLFEKNKCCLLYTSTDSKPLKIVMKEDAEVLDEVVVTALGIKRAQKALSYNVQQVGGDAINTVKDANFINSLQGKVAEMCIRDSDARLGEAVVLLVEKGADAELPETKMKELLSKYQLPKMILSVGAIPLTETGKINRAACRQLALTYLTDR